MNANAEEKPAKQRFQETIDAKTPLLIVMSGLPNTGKTTLAKRLKERLNGRIFSSDDLIERRAQEQGKTYDDVYEETIRGAEREYQYMLRSFLEDRKNSSIPAIVDRTNLTREQRRNLRGLATGRLCFIVYTETPFDAHRPGKTIPMEIIENMTRKQQIPEEDEGEGILKPEDLENVLSEP